MDGEKFVMINKLRKLPADTGINKKILMLDQSAGVPIGGCSCLPQSSVNGYLPAKVGILIIDRSDI